LYDYAEKREGVENNMEKSFIFAVCDKTQEDIQNASRCISEFYADKNIQVEIQQFDNTDKILDAFRSQNNFAAVFMGMNSMDEVDTAWILRKIAPKCPIIIMSYCGDYSLEGYRIDACAYWLKPFDEKKINSTLERLWNSEIAG